MLAWTTFLFTLALLGVQAVTYGWAYLAARHAADQAVQAARVEAGSAAAGQAQAQLIIEQTASGSLLGPQVQVTRDAQATTATVSGFPVQVIPLVSLPAVQVSVSAPTERFRPIPDTAP